MSSYADQEELDKLKEWWKNYGGSLVVGVVLGIGLLLGYRYWNATQEANRETASALYDQLRQELVTKGPDAATYGQKLINEYARTPYAAMASLILARVAYDSGDKTAARQRLEWALAHASDDATRLTARLRLARLLLDGGETKTAATLVADVSDTTGFEAEFNELKGDLALIQGQRDVARTAYREALKFLPATSPFSTVLNMKLDELGPEGKS